ncbi:LysR substrate-binding domain-containing protein [Streptomyces sp. NPDC059373]
MTSLKQLKTLRALQQHGTVHAAAAAQNLSPSAVSQQLQGLSEACGFPLVERHGRGIRLTRGGAEIAGLAHEIIALWESALGSGRERPRLPGAPARRMVRIGAFASALQLWVLPAVQSLRGTVPFRLEIFETEQQEAEQLLGTGELDVAVAACDAGQPAHGPLLAYRPLRDERFALVVPAAWPQAAADGTRLASFARAPWVLPRPESKLNELVVSRCAHQGFRPRAVARTGDWRLMQEMAVSLGAAALVPRSCLTGAPGLRVVDIAAEGLPRLSIGLLTRTSAVAAPWFAVLHRQLLAASAASSGAVTTAASSPAAA